MNRDRFLFGAAIAVFAGGASGFAFMCAEALHQAGEDRAANAAWNCAASHFETRLTFDTGSRPVPARVFVCDRWLRRANPQP